MSERRFGVGIIGLGWVAEQHLQAWKGNPHCAVVALCSSDRAKAESWGTRFGLQSKAYTDPEDLMRDPAVDIVRFVRSTVSTQARQSLLHRPASTCSSRSPLP